MNGSARRVREADLVGHLIGADELKQDEAPAGEVSAEEGAERPSTPRFELGGEDDYQLAQAIRLLKGEQIVQNAGK